MKKALMLSLGGLVVSASIATPVALVLTLSSNGYVDYDQLSDETKNWLQSYSGYNELTNTIKDGNGSYDKAIIYVGTAGCPYCQSFFTGMSVDESSKYIKSQNGTLHYGDGNGVWRQVKDSSAFSNYKFVEYDAIATSQYHYPWSDTNPATPEKEFQDANWMGTVQHLVDDGVLPKISTPALVVVEKGKVHGFIIPDGVTKTEFINLIK